MTPLQKARKRAWLEYVIETAIDMLDDLDAAETDLEDDELEIITLEDQRRRA